MHDRFENMKMLASGGGPSSKRGSLSRIQKEKKKTFNCRFDSSTGTSSARNMWGCRRLRHHDHRCTSIAIPVPKKLATKHTNTRVPPFAHSIRRLPRSQTDANPNSPSITQSTSYRSQQNMRERKELATFDRITARDSVSETTENEPIASCLERKKLGPPIWGMSTRRSIGCCFLGNSSIMVRLHHCFRQHHRRGPWYITLQAR